MVLQDVDQMFRQWLSFMRFVPRDATDRARPARRAAAKARRPFLRPMSAGWRLEHEIESAKHQDEQ